ncbi:MAG: hypothetical protein KC613_22735, partial [Myxococcales bacterium]|nr:hypothetical protein [Myxococcales bacterium]
KIYVVPAFGKSTGDYLPKLGRVYLERGGQGPEPWHRRLQRMVKALEDKLGPDVVLLDSRTGLHDTSAALVMAMGAHTLMFALDTEQTWSAYKFLLDHWNQHPQVAEFRVFSSAPPGGRGRPARYFAAAMAFSSFSRMRLSVPGLSLASA